jgi:hypothetical protein
LLLLASAAGAQPPPSASVTRDGDAIVFDGRIDQRSAEAFLRLVAEPAVRRVVIRSPGGLVAPALEMGEAIHARALDVEVDHACYSSCANYIFPAGRRKVLSGPAAVGWHGNMAHVLYRAARGEEHWSDEDLASARVLARREQDFFRRIGVDGFVTWFGKLPPYGVDEFYALSVSDMAGFGITGVTVRDPYAPAAGDVRMIAVDWDRLRATRPEVDVSNRSAHPWEACIVAFAFVPIHPPAAWPRKARKTA